MEISTFFDAPTIRALNEVVQATWFYIMDLVGTVAFAISGVIRAHKQKYDYFGTFVLASLPAVGGGTLRDLLVGGDRHPPFVFRDPNYFICVFVVVIAGIALSRVIRSSEKMEQRLNFYLDFTDTIGVAAFTIIGAKVAIVANLNWFWVPILAATTCAGGGILLDIISDHEPGVLKGKIYEEVAAVGGIFLLLLLYLADLFPDPYWFVVGAILGTFVATFGARWVIIKKDIRSPLMG